MYLQLANGNTLALASGGKLLLSGYYVQFLATAIASVDSSFSASGVMLATAIASVDSTSTQSRGSSFDSNAETVARFSVSAKLVATAIASVDSSFSASGVMLATAIASVDSISGYGGPFTFEANAETVIKFGVSATFIAEAIAEAIAIVPDYRPERPTNFKAVRTGGNITLTWEDGAETYSVQVQKADGQREESSVTNTIAKDVQTLTLSANTGTNYTFQLIPIGITNNKGKASYIVYSTADSKILQ